MASKRSKKQKPEGAESETEVEEEATVETQTVSVKATRRGEFPVGVMREAGDEFTMVLAEGEKLPSWVKDVNEEVESRVAPGDRVR
jgi:hypothetical protein